MQEHIPDWFSAKFPLDEEKLKSWSTFPFDQPQDADEKGFLSCHQNDYLRLSAHPKVVEAKNEATSASGSGAMASIVYGGAHGYHTAFRQRVAEVTGVEKADGVLLTTCGWTANVGLVEAITEPDMPIYLDISAHASLWDGARLSPGRLVPIRHNRPEKMRTFLETYGKGIMIIDAYYSTTGAVSPLEEYVELAEEFNCMLILDEAHSFGMTGKNGGGYAVEKGLQDRVHVRTVSLAKALGGNGGLIIANEKISQWLMWRLRPVIFSSSPPPANSAGNLAALNVLIDEPQRAKQCHEMAAYLRELFAKENVDTGPSTCQIVSLNFKSEHAAIDLYGELKKRKILFSVFLAPAVPPNSSLARFSMYANLTKEDVEMVARETIDAMKMLGIESRFPKIRRKK